MRKGKTHDRFHAEKALKKFNTHDKNNKLGLEAH